MAQYFIIVPRLKLNGQVNHLHNILLQCLRIWADCLKKHPWNNRIWYFPLRFLSLSLRWVTAKPLKITEAGTTTKVWTHNTYCKPQQKAGLPHTWVSDQQKFEEIIAETHEHIQKNKQPDSFLVLYWNYYTSKPDSTVTRCFYKYNPCFNVNY